MSSRLFPQAAYAEDQPYASTILVTHVLHRGFTMGALGGIVVAPAVLAYQRRQLSKAAGATAVSAPASTITAIPPQQPKFAPILLKSAGRGAVAGTALLAVGLTGLMRGKQDIEWKDRSWRLLANEGQVLHDDFSVAGGAVGLATGLRSGAVNVGWAGVVGRAGIGMVAGTAAYMVFQYAVRPMVGGGKKEVGSL